MSYFFPISFSQVLQKFLFPCIILMLKDTILVLFFLDGAEWWWKPGFVSMHLINEKGEH